MSDAQAYPNRSDLRGGGKVARTVATGQTYGAAARQMESQRAVPMGKAPTEVAPQRPRVQPGTLGALTRPTERPGEPVTAGANFGAGPNSAAAGIPVPRSPRSAALDEIRAIAAITGSKSLLDLVNAYSGMFE
jgi:hypothetical protein